MRLTWLVLGVVVAAGAVAFIRTEDGPPTLPAVEGADRSAPPPLNRPQGQAPAPAMADVTLSEAQVAQEKQAQGILEKLAAVRAGAAAADASPEQKALEQKLRAEAWGAPSARRWAYAEGRRLLKEAGPGMGKAAVQAKDRARRLLSRVLYLPEMFKDDGSPTDERTRLIDQIQQLNRQVMHYGPGVEGVTAIFTVPRGVVPVQIVSREKLPMGSNAVLYWNQGGNLDPKRLRAEQVMLLPQEELTLHVHQRWRRLGVFLGDWFVKEFRVGIGKEDTPTPFGTFWVHSREKNPDWWKPGGKRIPYGDPRNELGSAWIAIVNEEWPQSAGYGIHGTNKPDTVGTRCSNGCVRLVNAEATELYDWVRTASNEGRATRVIIE